MNDTTGQLQAAIDNAVLPDVETRLELYRLMQSCRVMEQRAYDLFMQNLIKGTSHLALGQEAIAAGDRGMWSTSSAKRLLFGTS